MCVSQKKRGIKKTEYLTLFKVNAVKSRSKELSKETVQTLEIGVTQTLLKGRSMH